jgi:chromate transporter
MSGMTTVQTDRGRLEAVTEVFLAFLRLGLTSFGGPVAHLGYFHEAFVVRRRWLTERAYADVVALCQFLPGPASSQVGMALGLQRAGFAGMLAAWVAFTLPSAVLLVLFAFAITAVAGVVDAGWIGGLKAAAVAVVAQAVFTMARTLTPDRRRATLAAATAIGALLAPNAALQVAAIAVAGVIGMLWLHDDATASTEETERPFAVRVPRAVAVTCLLAYGALLAALLLAAGVLRSGPFQLFGIFYRAGALVFGGGHVVLPLLESQTVRTGLVGHDDFLAGYGAAQAVPGPLFTFAAFLGAVNAGSPSGIGGAAIALIGIFLPGALLVVGALPFWLSLRRLRRVRRAVMGINAGVVGLLAAALYSPVFTEGITSPAALAIAVAAFVALTRWSVPPWAVVIAAGVLGAVLL